MSLLDEIRAAVGEVQADSELNALRFRHQGTWSDGTRCRFSVQDPNKGKDVRAITTTPEVASLRVLRVHPGDKHPTPGASTSWETGTLFAGPPSDASDFTGQSAISCRMVDTRYYPTSTASSAGQSILVRIEALTGQAVRAGSGVMDVQAIAMASHRGHLPPGIRLQQGEALTTVQGEHYRVMDPIQHDVLGDKVGLSREGTGVWG